MSKQNVEYEIANGPGNTASPYGGGVLRIARAKWDFAVDGGAISTITPGADYNTLVPNVAIIIGGTVNATTAMVGTSGTLAIACGGITPLTANAITALDATDDVLNVTATFASPLKTTAAGWITFTIATTAMTAGVVEVTLLYFVADA